MLSEESVVKSSSLNRYRIANERESLMLSRDPKPSLRRLGQRNPEIPWLLNPEAVDQTLTTGFDRVPILSIVILTMSPSCNVNSGGGIVPVPVSTVVPSGTVLWRCSQSAR